MMNFLRGGMKVGGDTPQPTAKPTPPPKKEVSEDSEQSDEEDRDEAPAALDQDPREYAGEILELEIQAEEADVKVEVIQKLMTLYTRAVNFYVERHSDQYKYFKKKMRNLLVQPQINEALEVAQQEKQLTKSQLHDSGQPGAPSDKSAPRDGKGGTQAPEPTFKPDRKKIDYEMKKQQFELEKTLISVNKIDKMSEMMRNHEINSTRNNALVHTGFKKQIESIQEKLAMRKMGRSVVSRDHSSTWDPVGMQRVLGGLSVAGDISPRTHSQERKSDGKVELGGPVSGLKPLPKITDPHQLGGFAPQPNPGLGMKRSISHGVFLKSTLAQESLFASKPEVKQLSTDQNISSSTGGQTDPKPT